VREPFWWPMMEPPLPGEFEEGTPHVLRVIDQARAGILIALGRFHEQLEMEDE
jgi:hypothetical protein